MQNNTARQLSTTATKPILKWAGGKTQMLPDLLPKVPTSYGRYIEPFFGGGALFFSLCPEKAIIADSNPELINLYRQVADNVESVIFYLKQYENTSEIFYSVRSLDWEQLSKPEAAARTLFLNRTCYNGLYRVNKKGQFNVPYGKYKNPKIIPPDMKNVGWKVSINCLIYAHKQTKTLSGGIFNSPVWLLSEEKGEEGRKSMEYVLELKNIYKSFPGVKVLEDVTLQVRPGEVHALMGENGAGKSTLMKILMGIYKADQGSIFLEGKETVIHGPKDAMSKGISMIHQELNTVLDMEVAENVFVGRELLKKGFEKLKIVDIARMREETGKYFREMNIDIDPRAKMRTLSVAEMQLVEIVKAISLNSRIIVMDEPTSAITEKEATVLFAQIERLKKQGVAIIYISHKMDEIFRISDTITVLRDGQLIGTKLASELDNQKIIEMMVGRDLDNYIQNTKDLEVGDVCLEVRDLNNAKLKNINFTLRRGEILGFAGLVGAGRTETAKAIFGIDPISSGQIFVNGKEVKIKSASDAIKAGIGYVPENRKEEGLVLMGSIKSNLTISVLEEFIKGCFVNKKKEHEIIDEYAKKLSIKMASVDQLVQYLSGGNQQKVVLSKWLATKPDILILDEPTRGIDIGAKTEIYHLIVDMAKAGVAVMLISSEMEEIMNLSTRIIVMYEGHIKATLDEEETKKVAQEEIMWYASGRAKDEGKA